MERDKDKGFSTCVEDFRGNGEMGLLGLFLLEFWLMALAKIKGADLLCVEKRRWEERELGEVPVEVKRLNKQFAAATLAISGAAKERGGGE